MNEYVQIFRQSKFSTRHKNMTVDELDLLAKDIRKFLVRSVSQTGGHLASNLGVVELT